MIKRASLEPFYMALDFAKQRGESWYAFAACSRNAAIQGSMRRFKASFLERKAEPKERLTGKDGKFLLPALFSLFILVFFTVFPEIINKFTVFSGKIHDLNIT